MRTVGMGVSKEKTAEKLREEIAALQEENVALKQEIVDLKKKKSTKSDKQDAGDKSLGAE